MSFIEKKNKIENEREIRKKNKKIRQTDKSPFCSKVCPKCSSVNYMEIPTPDGKLFKYCSDCGFRKTSKADE